MLLDGESGGSYHNWQALTPALKKQLDQTGLFQVDVVTAPPANGDFSDFKPEFDKYQAVVMNYDAPDARWSADLKASFEKYMTNGGGLVIVHAADNAFPGWVAFNEMIGIGGWRGRNAKVGSALVLQRREAGVRQFTRQRWSHGNRLAYRITLQDANHPITKGLPKRLMHLPDELYAKMRGPGENMTVLATAFSDPANRGTGNEEPALMVLSFGKGRIFHSIFGHDVYALSCGRIHRHLPARDGVGRDGEGDPEGSGLVPNRRHRELPRRHRGDGSELPERGERFGFRGSRWWSQGRRGEPGWSRPGAGDRPKSGPLRPHVRYEHLGIEWGRRFRLPRALSAPPIVRARISQAF